jgi:hypothetical protein
VSTTPRMSSIILMRAIPVRVKLCYNEPKGPANNIVRYNRDIFRSIFCLRTKCKAVIVRFERDFIITMIVKNEFDLTKENHFF